MLVTYHVVGSSSISGVEVDECALRIDNDALVHLIPVGH